MPRACVIVLDAVGVGELPDAAEWGAIVFALIFPTVLTWVYFIALADSERDRIFDHERCGEKNGTNHGKRGAAVHIVLFLTFRSTCQVSADIGHYCTPLTRTLSRIPPLADRFLN